MHILPTAVLRRTTVALLMMMTSSAVNTTLPAQMSDMMTEMMEVPPQEMADMMKDADSGSGAAVEWRGACTTSDFQAVAELMASCQCQPRASLVPVQAAGAAVLPLPWLVVTRRCSGWCVETRTSCMPTSSRLTRLPVFQHGFDSSGQLRCGDAVVEEHLSCGCSCAVTAADCQPALHEYDRARCRCQCRQRQQCGGGRSWDETGCRCVCPRRRHCSSGYGWSEESCSCMMLMPGTEQPPDPAENEIGDQ